MVICLEQGADHFRVAQHMLLLSKNPNICYLSDTAGIVCAHLCPIDSSHLLIHICHAFKRLAANVDEAEHRIVKIQNGFIFLVLTYPGCVGKGSLDRCLYTRL